MLGATVVRSGKRKEEAAEEEETFPDPMPQGKASQPALIGLNKGLPQRPQYHSVPVPVMHTLYCTSALYTFSYIQCVDQSQEPVAEESPAER